MDVNAVSATVATLTVGSKNHEQATENLKRLRTWESLRSVSDQGLNWIDAFQETKTVWHPVGV